MLPVSLRPEDAEFVNVAIDELRKLGLEKYSPSALIWTKHLPAHQCLLHRGYLLMPVSMVGKLEPEDWRGIIASVALFREISKKKRGSLVGIYFLAFILVFVILIGSVFLIDKFGKNLGIGPLGGLPRPLEDFVNLGITGVLLLLGALIMQGRLRRLRLKADELASVSPGGGGLLQSLEKIQGLQPRVRTGRLRLLLSRFPTLSRRIGNLRKKTRETLRMD